MAKVASPETLGADVKVVITDVNSDGYFFVQLDTKDAYSISVLSDKIATIVDSNRPTYSPDLGSQCFALSMADDSWYRALVLENSESTHKATVYFVDYGNVESDLPLTRLAPATDDIFRLPYQAVKCQLAGFVPIEENWSPEVVYKLKQFIFNQEFSAVFHSLIYSPSSPFLDNPCYSVSLYWEKGSDTVAAELIGMGFGQHSLVAETVTLSTATAVDVCCCYVCSPDSVWVQLASKHQVLEEITSVLNSGEISMTNLAPECLYPGVVCCTQFVDDQQFYRSTILSYPDSDGKISVLFSDFGNTAAVFIQDVFALPSSLVQYPALAIECAISGIRSVEQPGSWTDQAVNELAGLIQDQELKVTVLSQEPGCCYYINAKLADDSDVSDVLIQAGHAIPAIDENVAQVETDGPSLDPYQPQTLQVGQQYTVYVTMAESPAVVWCQLAESTDFVSELTQRLADKAGSFIPVSNTSVNQVCCIQYSQDQAWYRGVVQMIDGEVAEVLLVDYGNIEVVSVSSLHTLPQDLYFCPPLAASFSLYGIAPIDGAWKDAALQRFEELYFNMELTCNVVGLDDDGYPAVKLVVAATSQDIASVLVKEGYAVSTVCEQPTPKVEEKSSLSAILSQILPAYPLLSVPTGTRIAVCVTDIISFKEFSCQLLSSFDDLSFLMENIKEHCSSSDAKQVPFVHPGMSVIAPFSVDKGWYRAAMLRPDHIGQWSVQFVDYGNQETVLLDNLIEIEPEFLKLPPQAFVCTLSGSKEKLSDNDSALENFSDLVLEKEVECVVRKKRQDGVYVVELYSDGRSVNDIIGMALEEATPTASPKKTSAQQAQLLSPQHSSPQHQQSSPQTAVSLSTPPMPTRPLSQRIKKLINLQLPMLKVPVNRSVSVCVCFLESPAYFSCQLVDQYQALNDLVGEMSKFYSNQSPQHASSIVVSSGTFCAAIFSQDKQWYRAVIIGKHPRLDFADVLFIDYGNSDVVPLSSLRKLESQFKRLPCQSICCQLVDSDPQDLVLDKLVTAEFLEMPTTIAKPVPCRLSNFEIEESIAKVASLSLEESSEQRKSSPKKPVSPKKQSSDSVKVDSFQPTLNSPSLATVSYIISPHEIYCQPLVSSQELSDLMGVLFVYYVEQTKGSCLSGPDITGSYCAVPYADGSYYRGKVLSVVDDCAQVFYIDYGNTDPVPLTDVSVLDRQFASLPAQAIKCSLSDISSITPSWSTESIAVLMDTALNKEMNVTYLSEAADGSYGVKMLGADNLSLSDFLIMSGMGVKSELPKPSSLSVSPTLLKPGIQEDVILTAVLSDCNMYCQLLSSEEALSILSDGIVDHVSTSQSYGPDTFTTGMLVLAQFSEDNCWYRSRITSISEDAVQVIFIDYGNTETLHFSRLSSISPELCQLPAQAILCKLNKLEKYTVTESTSQSMSDTLLNSILTLKCHQVESGVHTVDLTSESFGSVLQHMVDSGFVNQVAKCTGIHCEPPDVKQSTVEHGLTPALHCVELSHINIEPFSKFEATFSYFETPRNIFCQLTASSAVIEDLQSSLNEYYSITASSRHPSISDLKTNQFVATKFSEDGCWYRGEIMSIDLANSTVNVLFVDYGNSEWTSLENICYLDVKFTNLQIQGIRCALVSVQPPSGSEWSDEAIDTIYDLCMAQTKVTIDAGETISGVLGVREIFDEQGESILQQLVATNLAKWKNTPSTPQSDPPPVSTTTMTTTTTTLSTQKYPPVNISSGDSELVYISHSEPDGTIWIQLDSRGLDLDEINSRIATVYSSDQKSFPFTPVIGASCCALFADDEQWYRSKVMSVSDQDVQVLFVDYGNSENISPDCICSLKPEFSSVSPFAIHCQLSTSSPPLPPNAIEELFMLQFVKPLADDESMWEVVVSLEDGSSNQDIPQPSSTVAVIPELSLCQGQTHSVFISIAESPDQFWCQMTSQYDTLEALMATVGDFYADNNPPVTIVPGMFCVSQFSENSAWYRAKILNVQSPDQVEVMYVDYGNRQVVESAEQICGLDRRFAGIPCQAFCCSLLPTPQAEYPDDKLEAFFSLNFDEDTFHVTLERFLPSGRWLVSLADKTGKSINDLFAPSSVDTGSVLSSSSIPVSSSELSPSYPDLLYHIGATVDVFVTSVMSPSSFYCQPLHLSTDLDQLMEDVANYMATKEEHQQQEVSVGQACLACYSVDKNWYRARIDDFDEETGKCLAKFIDYGNSEYLESGDVAFIPEQFVSTPSQVLHCSVVEVDHNTSWSDEKKDTFKLSVCEEEQYTLKIVSFSPSKHKYVVEVMCDGEPLDISFLGEMKISSAPPTKPVFKEGGNSLDLSDVQTSFSGPDLSINSVTAIKGSKTPTTDPEESEGESIATGEPLIHAPFKLSLATTEVVDVEVVYVQNPSYICVQRLDCSAALEGLSAEIDQYCDYADKLTQHSYHSGDFVLAQFSDDNVWYRAQVKSISDDDLYEVQFIDFGNSDFLPPTKLIMCPGNFLDLPVQAIPCSLAQVPNREVWPDVYKQIIDELVQNKVMKVTVVVAGSHGMPATVVMEDSETGVQVSQKILEQLQDECEDGNLSFDFVASTELHVPPETNELEEIAEEEEDTLLDEDESNEKKEQYHSALEATVESLVQRVRTMSMEELEAENLQMADLQDSASNTETDKLDSIESFPTLTIGAKVNVRVLACNSLDEFVCQFLDSSFLEAIAQAIQEEDHNLENQELLNADLPVLAWHEEDKSWYRGLIADVSEPLDTVTIILVDLGVSKTLPITEIHHISAKIAQIAPPQCFTCQLSPLLEADLDPVLAGADEELEWPSHCQEYFQEQVKEKDSFLAEIIQKKENIFVVQLFIVESGESLRDNVIARMAQSHDNLDCLNLETTQDDEEEEEDTPEEQITEEVRSLEDNGVQLNDCEKVKGQDSSSRSFSTVQLLAGQEIKLTICSPFISDEFICQPTEDTDSLDAMMKELKEHMSLPSDIALTDFKIDQPVVVHKEEEEKWYRAQVQKINTDHSEVQVRHVDYGTIETLAASRVSTIPDHFLSLPKQAITCLLTEEHEQIIEELKSSSDQRVVAKVLSVTDSKEAAVVLIIDNDQSVSAKLTV